MLWPRTCAKLLLIGYLFVAPGQPGCARVARTVPLSLTDHEGEIVGFCRRQSIDLVVVGPEGPSVSGIAYVLAAAGIACSDRRKGAALLEGSKG